jgi:hypothetical protein
MESMILMTLLLKLRMLWKFKKIPFYATNNYLAPVFINQLSIY